MEKEKVVEIQKILSILTIIGIFFLIFNVYFIFRGFGKDVLHINNSNRQSVKNIIEKSGHSTVPKNFNDVKKIQFFLALNDLKFTFYYKDGTIEEIYDDYLTDLKVYIQKNGFNNSKFHIVLEMGVLFICLILTVIRVNLANEPEE